jgi:anti-sigma B factor antagonist
VVAATRGPILGVSIARTGTGAVLRLDGELDIATAPQLAAAVAGVLDATPPPERVVIDAEQLMFVDASGLSPLLEARRRLGPGGLRLRNVRPPVLRVLRLLDLADALGLDC